MAGKWAVSDSELLETLHLKLNGERDQEKHEYQDKQVKRRNISDESIQIHGILQDYKLR